ncbi:MAG: 4Fe-4S binding protein [Thermodesulfobacteriota bacterium]
MEVIRKWVQTVAFLFMNSYWAFPWTATIYQGPLKVVCSPGLNCYSCPAAIVSCPIGALQQLFLSARLTLGGGQLFLGFYVVGTMGILGSMFGRMICGWFCPFGYLQELLYRLPSPKFFVPRPLRFVKYAILLLTVILLPLLVVNEFGLGLPWFCKYICPAGTLEAGLPMLILQPDLRQIISTLFYSKLTVLIFFLLWSVVASRPFCQTTCPLGAWYGLFTKVKFVRLTLDKARCTNCGECHHVCPMGVKFNESPDDAECITCLKCLNQACQFGAISLEVAGLPVRSLDIRRLGRADENSD